MRQSQSPVSVTICPPSPIRLKKEKNHGIVHSSKVIPLDFSKVIQSYTQNQENWIHFFFFFFFK